MRGHLPRAAVRPVSCEDLSRRDRRRYLNAEQDPDIPDHELSVGNGHLSRSPLIIEVLATYSPHKIHPPPVCGHRDLIERDGR